MCQDDPNINLDQYENSEEIDEDGQYVESVEIDLDASYEITPNMGSQFDQSEICEKKPTADHFEELNLEPVTNVGSCVSQDDGEDRGSPLSKMGALQNSGHPNQEKHSVSKL